MVDSIPIYYIDEETRELFSKTRDLLDQILETFEIIEDSSVMKEIVSAQKEYQEGKFISLEDYKQGKRSFG